jgi:2-C-methyl-D-erythritol 4-phosphate cytidylyltransferase
MNDSPSEFPPSPRFWALIPCAGSGSRAATAGPKQYEPIAGQPMVEHTLRAFAGVRRLAATVVVLAPDDLGSPLQPTAEGPVLWITHCGGQTRAQSVLNGLQWLVGQAAFTSDWVLVHDAARCLITPQQVNRLIDACAGDAVGGLLAHKLADTLKQQRAHSDPVRVAATVERSDKWLAQTPQMFRVGTLIQALQRAGPGVTDEASAIEAAGLEPLLVEGGSLNFKVTYPEDFLLAEAVLARRTSSHTHKDAA